MGIYGSTRISHKSLQFSNTHTKYQIMHIKSNGRILSEVMMVNIIILSKRNEGKIENLYIYLVILKICNYGTLEGKLCLKDYIRYLCYPLITHIYDLFCQFDHISSYYI
jgi:hypothetical protein